MQDFCSSLLSDQKVELPLSSSGASRGFEAIIDDMIEASDIPVCVALFPLSRDHCLPFVVPKIGPGLTQHVTQEYCGDNIEKTAPRDQKRYSTMVHANASVTPSVRT